MSAQRLPCSQCNAMILHATSKHTNGLCMPCFNKSESESVVDIKNTLEAELKSDAVCISTSDHEELFLMKVAIHCDLDCCGLDAIDISEAAFSNAIKKVGYENAKSALGHMKSNRNIIGKHKGYVNFRGYFEPARRVAKNYDSTINLLQELLS